MQIENVKELIKQKTFEDMNDLIEKMLKEQLKEKNQNQIVR